MLQTIRDRASGWIAYAVILLISIPFALWGVNHYLDGGGKEAVADVDGTPISIKVFARAYQEKQLQLQQMFGGKIPSGLDAQTVKQMVLGDLIRNAVFHRATAEAGYQTTNKEVVDQLIQYPAFQVDGKFSKDRYVQVLRAQGLTPARFEERLRLALNIEQFQQGVLQSSFMPTSEAKQILRLLNEKRDVVLSIIPYSQFVGSVNVAGKQVDAYYNKHKADYMTPEKVRLSYLRLTATDMNAAGNVSEADLHQYYLAHRAQFETPERAEISEIVVNLNNDSSSQVSPTTRLRAVAAGLKKGESFASLAEKYSQAPSAKEGGKMGNVTRASLPLELSNAVFSLKPGQVTPPLKVKDKVYRLKLDVLHQAQKPAFATVRNQIKTAYVKAQTEHLFDTQAQRLTTLTYQNPGTLEPAAKGLGLKVMKTDWLTQSGGSGIGGNSKVLKAAFSDAVLHNGSNSQPIEIGKHDVVVIRVLEHKSPEQESLDAVRGRIREVLVKQAAKREAERIGKALIAMVKTGKASLSEASKAEAAKVSVQALGWIGRNGSKDVPSSVMTAAFQLPPPAGKKAAVSGLQLSDGDYGVVSVRGIKSTPPETAAVKNAQAQLSKRIGQAELQVVYQALQQADKVKVYPSNMNF